MGMKDPIPQFSHVVSELARRHPSFAYVHVVEPRVNGYQDIEIPEGQVSFVVKLLEHLAEPAHFSPTISSAISGGRARSLAQVATIAKLHLKWPRRKATLSHLDGCS